MKKHLFLLMLAAICVGCVHQGGAQRTPTESLSDGDEKRQQYAKIHTELAAMYYAQSQLGVALGELDEALRVDARYAPAYGMRGLVYMALRDDKAAEQDFLYSLKLDERDSEVQNNYGWFLCERDRVKEAMPHFLFALRNPLYSTPERAYLNAAMCSQKIGNTRDAIDFFQRVTQIQPDNKTALFALASLNLSKGRIDSAKKYFSDFSKDHKDWSAEELWFAVRLMHKTNDKGSESNYALRLLKLFPDANETELLKREQYD